MIERSVGAVYVPCFTLMKCPNSEHWTSVYTTVHQQFPTLTFTSNVNTLSMQHNIFVQKHCQLVEFSSGLSKICSFLDLKEVNAALRAKGNGSTKLSIPNINKRRGSNY